MYWQPYFLRKINELSVMSTIFSQKKKYRMLSALILNGPLRVKRKILKYQLIFMFSRLRVINVSVSYNSSTRLSFFSLKIRLCMR